MALTRVPNQYHTAVSIAIGVLLIFSFVQIIRRQFIWFVVLVVLFPASLPVLRGVADGVIVVLKFLFGSHS